MHPDDPFLARAIELAGFAVSNGDGGPFGAVIVRDGKVIGEGWNRVVATHDPTAHAEVIAIREACAALGQFHLAGATLYASSEPCPMCLAAAYWARVDRIVFANQRSEAAAIGFCDDELYAELGQPVASRHLPMEHRPLPGARDPLAAWAGQPNRVRY